MASGYEEVGDWLNRVLWRLFETSIKRSPTKPCGGGMLISYRPLAKIYTFNLRFPASPAPEFMHWMSEFTQTQL